MTHRVHNFSAGPAAMPLPVLERIQAELLDFEGTGMSIMEMSHRSKTYDRVHNECMESLRKLLGVGDDYRVLFMGGGARTQFAILAMNLLSESGWAGYVTTGNWSATALTEARKIGDAREIWTSEADQFDHVPEPSELPSANGADYVHTTSNNTLYGTEYPYDPDTGGVPHVCDMSSDIFSRPVDASRYAVVYAGAQKNLGPAGVTLVFVRRDMLDRARSPIPGMMHWATLDKKDSLLNTPPVFPIYAVGLVAKHVLDLGGAEAMQAHNAAKAELLYGAIDGSGGFYRGHAQPGSRSRMNVTYRIHDPELEPLFLEGAAKADLSGLKGHRSVGGLRASIYNATSLQSVQALVSFMEDFQATRG